MSISVVQHTPVGAGSFITTPVTAAFPGAVTVGNTIIACLGWDGNDSNLTANMHVTDNLGNVYTLLASFTQSLPPTSIASIGIWVAPVTVGGTPTLTTGTSTANPRGGMGAIEVSGLDNTSLFDVSTTGHAETGTSVTTGTTATTARADEISVAVGLTIAAGASTMSAGTGYAVQVQGVTSVSGQLAITTKILSATGTESTTITGMKSGGYNAILLATFKGPIPTHSISGNAGVASATVAYSGTASGSVSADGSGNYTIPSLVDGSYTITPSKTGFTFSPANQGETVSGANITGVNFTALLNITGNTRVAGASVAYSGGASGTVTADGSGNFTISAVPIGTDYFLTPSKTGYTFFPEVMKRTLVGADVTNCLFDNILIPFNSYTEQAYESAYVANVNPITPANWDTVTGLDPLKILNSTIQASTVNSCISLLDGFGDITGDAYAFMHVSSMVDNSSVGLLTLSDIDSITFYEIYLTRSGSSLTLSLGDGTGLLASGSTSYAANFTVRIEYIQGTLTAYINNTSVLSAATTNATTGSSGIEIEVSAATTDDQVIDFAEGSITYVAPNYTISGNIGDTNNETVNLTGTQTRSTFAAGFGDYSFAGCVAGPYTVTPVPPPGFVFTPTSRNVTVSTADVPNIDFTIGPAPPSGSGDSDFSFEFKF